MNKYLKVLNITYGFCITQLLIRFTDMAYHARLSILFENARFIKNTDKLKPLIPLKMITAISLLLIAIILKNRINLKKYSAIPLALLISAAIMLLPSGFYIFRQWFLVISYVILLITWIIYLIQSWNQSQQIKKSSIVTMLLLFCIPITITIAHPIVMQYATKDIKTTLNTYTQNKYDTTFENLSQNQRIEVQSSDFYEEYRKQNKMRFQIINLIAYVLICLMLLYSSRIQNILIATGVLLLSQWPGFLDFEVPVNFLNINIVAWIFILTMIALTIILYGIRKWNQKINLL